MTTKQFEKLVASYGATIDWGDGGGYTVDAPPGKVWACADLHELASQWRNVVGQTFRREAYADTAERMAYGLVDCPNEDCDVCDESRRDELSAAKGGAE